MTARRNINRRLEYSDGIYPLEAYQNWLRYTNVSVGPVSLSSTPHDGWLRVGQSSHQVAVNTEDVVFVISSIDSLAK